MKVKISFFGKVYHSMKRKAMIWKGEEHEELHMQLSQTFLSRGFTTAPESLVQCLLGS